MEEIANDLYNDCQQPLDIRRAILQVENRQCFSPDGKDTANYIGKKKKNK